MCNKTLIGLNSLLQDRPMQFFEKMGGLHDCEIVKLCFGTTEKVLKITVDDLYSNFIGLDEYVECKNIKIIFKNYILVKMDLSTSEHLVIDELIGGDKFLKIYLTNGDEVFLQPNIGSSIKLETSENV